MRNVQVCNILCQPCDGTVFQEDLWYPCTMYNSCVLLVTVSKLIPGNKRDPIGRLKIRQKIMMDRLQ